MHGLNPKIAEVVHEGRTHVSHLTFRQGLQAKETLPFYSRAGTNLFIDVADDGLPVAMELVFSGQEKLARRELTEEHLLELFAFCTKMIAFQESNQQPRANALVDTAASVYWGAPPTQQDELVTA